MPIKAILWDMGSVLVRMTDERPRKLLAQQFNLDLHHIYQTVFSSPTAGTAARGAISIEEHWEAVRQILGLAPEVMPAFRRRFWEADALDTELVEYLRRLHPHYKLALLSNAWDDLRQTLHDRWGADSLFDELIISAEVKLIKPEPEIYRLALARLGVQPDEAVLLDDVWENVAGARAVGMYAIQYRNFAQAYQELETLLAGGRPYDPLDLVRLQIGLEYQLDPQGLLAPIPGSSEQGWYVLYQYPGGAAGYINNTLPAELQARLAALGPAEAAHAPGQVSRLLEEYLPPVERGIFRSGYLPRAPQETTDLVTQEGQTFVIRVNGRMASSAWSVREDERCAELAVETEEPFRQHGYAAQVTAAWTRHVLSQGRVPLYSYAADNLASAALARRLGVVLYATCWCWEAVRE